VQRCLAYASRESGQIWIRTHRPKVYAVSWRLRCEARKTGHVLIRTSGCEQVSDYSHETTAMSGCLILANRLYMRNNNSCIAYSKTDHDTGLRLAFLNLRIIEDGALASFCLVTDDFRARSSFHGRIAQNERPNPSSGVSAECFLE
jgi:hypothetical protein